VGLVALGGCMLPGSVPALGSSSPGRWLGGRSGWNCSRPFRWCRTFRRVQPPEWFLGAAHACRQCASAYLDVDGW